MAKRTNLRRALAVAGALALSGCADATVVQPATVTGTYSPSVLTYIDSRGGMLTEIVGNPFAAPPGRLQKVVLDIMVRSHFGPRFPFFTEAPEDFRSPYRTVVVFNPTWPIGSYKLCAGGAESRGPAEGVRIAAAFCARERVITAVSGWVDEASGPDDPRFRALVRRITHALFPPIDPNRDNGDHFRLRVGRPAVPGV